MGACLSKQEQTAEGRLCQAGQATTSATVELPESAKQQPESAKQQAAQASAGDAVSPLVECAIAGERQDWLRSIASDLLYWKGGLKVLRQAQFPKWRGSFQWQIEAKIESLQAEVARLRAEAAKEGE